MKKNVFIFLLLCSVQLNAQQPAPGNYQQQLDRALTPEQKKKLEQQMKKAGINGGLTAQYKKMMEGMMATSGDEDGFDFYENFTDNKQLVPTKQTARIKSIEAKINSNEEVTASIKAMYSKMMLKLPAAEKLLIAKIAAKYTKGTELTSAAVTATLHGRNQVAMGLAMQAVIAEPGNLVYQNNLAAILTNNGYPENAIPFLRKLNKEVSGNSTVLNNLAYAWLNLGETDSAKHFFSAGRTANPEHPDVICGNGLVEELSGGDPIEIFEDAFKKSPNVVTAKLGENRGKIFEVKDFDQIKNKIPIYEYFKKEWLTIPDLSNTAQGCQADASLKQGYIKMLERVKDTIYNIKKDLEKELAEIQKSSVGNKVKKASIRGKGGVFARYVIKTLAAYKPNLTMIIGVNIIQCNDNNEVQRKQLEETLRKIRESKEDEAISCKKEDEAITNYLKDVNPYLKKTCAEDLEKLRVWLNAFITYKLWDTRNSMTNNLDLCWVEVNDFLKNISAVINELSIECGGCRSAATDDTPSNIPEYILPKIDCPVNLTIPFGFMDDLLRYDGKTRISNITVAVGTGGIAEPGKGDEPYYKVTEGGICLQGFGDYDPAHPQNPQAQQMADKLKAMIELDCSSPNEKKQTPKAKNTNNVEDDLAPLKPVINNSIQSPGSNKGAIPGLFK